MNIPDRFLNAKLIDLIEYIVKLEKEIENKDEKIRELIIESTTLEVKLERYTT